MMHLEPYAFFDDAGKWQDRDFICLCGYISDGERWQSFAEQWQGLLRPSGLPSLHMANFFHVAHKKLGWNDVQAKAFLMEAAKIIRDNAVIGFSVGLDAKHYRGIPRDRRAAMPMPHMACIQRTLRRIRDRLADESYSGRIAFVLDEDEGSAVAIYRDILRVRKSRPAIGHYIGAVTFADDGFYGPLQAADMLANLSYGYLRDRASGRIGADLEDMPDVLKALIYDPATGIQRVEMVQELWSAEEINRGIDELIGLSEK